MRTRLQLYNTYTRQLEAFVPQAPPYVTLYLCGPTVYGPAHLGHARSAISFDVIVRYLRHLGYDVCYVRNITDVGHLVGDGDVGEDKVLKQAKAAQISPWEVAQQYGDGYLVDMERLNVLPPNITPRATAHIPEQIALVEQLLEKGWAYEVNGSVYFDLTAYRKKHPYGELSGRKLDELLSGSRTLLQSEEKRHAHDFALWKKASPNHLMQWSSPWGQGFPGWHLECTAMSQKYLGTSFDIHGGGLDLCFPHHECEIAQSVGATGEVPARYWLHNNLVTINREKMSKSANNFITLQQCFAGDHPLLSRAYSPMIVRFFMLQAHYRSPLSFSDEALQAACKGYDKLMNGLAVIEQIEAMAYTWDGAGDRDWIARIEEVHEVCYSAMDEDFHTSKALAALFGLQRILSQVGAGAVTLASLGEEAWTMLRNTYQVFLGDILGLKEDYPINYKPLIALLLEQYQLAKQQKDYAQVDKIRNALREQHIVVQDGRHGVSWSYQTVS